MSKRKAERPARKPAVVVAPAGGGWFGPPFFISLGLLVLTLAVYAPVRGFDFINYDDTDYISKNWRVLTGLTWDNVHWAFTTGYLGNWLPLTWLSHMLDAQLLGKGAGGPHLVNAVIHALNGVLVFVFLRRATGAMWRSALVAALFALHPLRVESVAWACERRDVLSAFFGLLAMICYVRYAQQKGETSNIQHRTSNIHWYCLSLLLFAFSLMSKAMLVTLPFALLLLDYWPLARFTIHDLRFTSRWLVLEKIPFLALAGIISLVTVKLQGAAGAVSSLGRLSLSARLENAVVSYARYLGKMFWPTELVLPYLHAGRWPMGSVALAAVLVAGLCVAAAWLGRSRRFVATGWFWFLGTLVPVIGIVQAGPQAMADRFVYLPGLGVIVIVVWGLGECLARWRVPKGVLVAGAMAVLGALAWRTADQLKYWRDTGTLFTHTLAVEPDNFEAMNGLGVFDAAEGRGDEALGLYQHALQVNPGHAQTLNNLGNLLASRRQYTEAIRTFRESLSIATNQPEAFVNLGGALAAMGRTDEAIAQFEAALNVRPDYPDALNNLGSTLALKGDIAGSIAQLRKVTQLRPDDADSHFNLGNALALGGQLDGAIAEFHEALRLQPGHARALGNLGSALGMQGHWPEAVADLQQALQINPDDAEAEYQLGRGLAKLGRRDEAIQHLLHVLQVRPGHPGAQQALREMGVPVTN